MTGRVVQRHGRNVEGRLPDFVIVGAMKAGSTTLWRYLTRHPQVFMPMEKKEPQYFSRDESFAKGEAWYRHLFQEAAAEQLCGEASTCYTRFPVYPKAAKRMADTVPDVKLIYVLRHPVERLYSHYVHEMSRRFVRGERLESFEVFSSMDDEARCASRYSLQIQQLLRHFPASRILIVLTDDLLERPARVLNEVQSFLGLEDRDLAAGGPEYANTSLDRVTRTPGMIWNRRMKQLRHAPILQRIIDRIPVSLRRRMRADLVRTVAGSSLGRWQSDQLKSRLSPLSPPVRWKLCREYACEARVIGAHINRNLDTWLW